MKLRILYHAEYSYEGAVSLSPHAVRIFPRRDHFLRLLEMNFSPPACSDASLRRDLFDNDIVSLFFPQAEEGFVLGMEALVSTPARNPFHFLLESRALRMPVEYTAAERSVLGAYLSGGERSSLPGELVFRGARPTVEGLVTLTSWPHANIRYERREEGGARGAAETLRIGSGSCRDFAALMLCILRANGVAARLVGGFLWEGDLAKGEKHVAEGAMHAWVEAYLPGAGWVGLDPTNGVFCDHHAIATAVGLSFDDIAPVLGTYYARSAVSGSLATSVRVTSIDE